MEDSYRLSEFAFQGRNFVYGRLRFEGQQDSSQTCILKESNGLMRLTVPFERNESEVAGWFLSKPEGALGDEDMETAIPQRLWLEEVETGKVFTLLGSRRSSYCGWGEGPTAYGTIASGLIIAGDLPGDYSKVKMMRSSFPELFRWIRFPAVTLKLACSDGSQTGEPDFTFKSKTFDVPGLPCAASLSAFSEIRFGFPGKGDSLNVQPSAAFETRFEQLADVAEAVEHHRHLKAFFSIVHWDDIGFDSIQMIPRDADVSDGLDGQSAQADAVLKRRVEDSGPFGRPPACFGFDDVGVEGLGKWFGMRDRYGRAIGRLEFAATSHDLITSESLVTVLCTALEEVADARCASSGVNAPRRFLEKLKVIRSFICEAFPALDAGLFDCVLDDIRHTYNAIKHTEDERGGRSREQWTTWDNLYDVAEACRLVLYAWIAVELGCPESAVVDCFQYGALDSMKAKWPFFDVAAEDGDPAALSSQSCIAGDE